MLNNLYKILIDYYKNAGKEDKDEAERSACRYAITFLIPAAEYKIRTCDIEFQSEYYKLYEKAYALAARRSLEHFIDYMEMDKQVRVLDGRRNILKPFLFYLNKIAFDDNMRYLICSYYPSAGKSFSLTYFTAWLYGLDINNSVIRMSYSEDLVLGFSRSTKELITNPRFCDVFEQYKQYGGNPFQTKVVDNWKLKDSSPVYSHMAMSRDGQITGKRANKAIIFDDMTKRSRRSNK